MAINELGISEIHIEQVKAHGFVVIDNAVDQTLIHDAREEYLGSLDRLELHAPKERFNPATLQSNPWRKLAIGSKTGSGEAYSQILQTTYFWENDARYPNLSRLFRLMIEARNSLIKVAPDYGSNLATDHFWNACRVHHYPRGGGHMAAHRDTLFPKLQEAFSIPFLQIMLTFSSRGTHFHQGGGFIVNREGEKHFFETTENIGALVLFDGATIHGVEDVDLDQVLNFNAKDGRVALFVNLYSNPNLA